MTNDSSQKQHGGERKLAPVLVSWVSEGTHREQLYRGRSFDRARDACFCAMSAITLLRATARVYIVELGGNDVERARVFERSFEKGVLAS